MSAVCSKEQLILKDSKKIHLPIIIEQDKDKVYIVSCPQFKGCHAQGIIIEEAMKNIEEVIEMCLEEEDCISVNSFIGFRDLEVLIA